MEQESLLLRLVRQIHRASLTDGATDEAVERQYSDTVPRQESGTRE